MQPDVALYRLGPFVIGSEIPFPELDAQESARPNVWIRIGRAPERLQNVAANESRWWASRDEYLLRVPGVAVFYVSQGREVTVEPAAGALTGDIRAYLLAPIFSCLCFQCGMYALHGSSVRVGDEVVSFLGDSGAGKSTLAACLEQRGFPVVSDDICLLDPGSGGEGRPRVIPVAPALKLWRSALDHLGALPERLPRVWSREDKYRLRIGHSEERLPLREIVFLEWEEDGSADVSFARVEGVQAVHRLMGYTHFDYLMKATGRQAESFLQSAAILRSVPAVALRRPRDFSLLQRVTDEVVAHLAGPAGAGRDGAKSAL